MTERQLALDLALPPRMGREDFLVTDANAGALAALDMADAWPGGRMLLHGPSGSGRSHLAAIWAAEMRAARLTGASLALPEPAPAYALDDADAVAGTAAREEALFHLLNRAQAEGAPLLMTARDTPGTWGVALPDLQSRLLSVATTRIGRPDDALVHMVLAKLFDERQVAVGPETLDYLARRIDRSLSAAADVVAALDRAALKSQKRISRPLAAEMLDARAAR